MTDQFKDLFEQDLFPVESIQEKTIRLKEGERRNVSILFADLHGFTALSEILDHEDLKDIIDQLFKLLSSCVEKFGGYVDKYSGDQIMALFGAKVASEVDTQRSLYCALEMKDKLNLYNEYLNSLQKFDTNFEIDMRIGVNSGMVTTGKVGMKREGDFTVYGDAVNLASRLESNAPVGEIVINNRTRELVEYIFNFESLGEFDVKGMSKKSNMNKVISIKSRDDEIIQQYQTPYISKEIELKFLESRYHHVVNNIGKTDIPLTIVGITGEAGMGKSRLVAEFIKNIFKDIDPRYYRVICQTSNITAKPYHLFTDLLFEYIGISPSDMPENIKNKLDNTYESLSEYLLENEIEQFNYTKNIIGFLIGLKSDDHRLQSRGDELNTHIQISLRVFIESVCAKANFTGVPFIFIFEDLHWVDSLSLSALKYILDTFNLEQKRQNTDLRFPLIIFDYRKDFIIQEELVRNVDFQSIEMQPLSDEDCKQFIKKVLKEKILPKHIEENLLTKAEGNPFYIEEWLILLLKKWKGKDDIFENEEILIPDNLNALVLSRIDLLEDPIKQVLQKASVIGAEFYENILSELHSRVNEKNNLRSDLDELTHMEFIRKLLSQEKFYAFKHIITRDVTYNTLLKSNRKILHGITGEIIEEYFSHSIESFYYELAIHYDIAENNDKAIEYLTLAADKAKKIYDNHKAISFYTRAIDLINNILDSQSIKLTIKLCQVNTLIGERSSSIELLETLFDKMNKETTTELYAMLLGGLSTTYYQIGDNEKAEK